MIEIIILCGVIFLFIILFKCYSCKKQNYKSHEPKEKEISSKLYYLNTYEHQDYYKENPSIYPVPYTATTAQYKIEREALKPMFPVTKISPGINFVVPN